MFTKALRILFWPVVYAGALVTINLIYGLYTMKFVWDFLSPTTTTTMYVTIAIASSLAVLVVLADAIPLLVQPLLKKKMTAEEYLWMRFATSTAYISIMLVGYFIVLYTTLKSTYSPVLNIIAQVTILGVRAYATYYLGKLFKEEK